MTVLTKRHHHNPVGDPCAKCGLMAVRHVVEHAPAGDPCIKCGLGPGNHRKVRSGAGKFYYAGIDGEGQTVNRGTPEADHRYVMLAWSNEQGTLQKSLEAPPGGYLTTEQCLSFILDDVPGHARLFSYSFGYDIAKILADLPDDSLYRLMRPGLRQYTMVVKGREVIRMRPVEWTAPSGRVFKLNLVSTKLSVTSDKVHRVVWDIWKFYQSKFTEACEQWKVADKERLDLMREMKDKRDIFDLLPRAEILAYCYEECQYMASLARRLTEAHLEAELTLRSYYGAGSTASCILKIMGVDKMNRATPPAMAHAVASAFFGGRFENRVLGPVEGPVWSYDISSAYPYQITFLPCLNCGHWRPTRNRADLEGARVALVRYSLGKPPADLCWGPFPFRTKSGSITFPSTSGGGWVWQDEYRQAERLYPHVRFHGAWVYETDCDHTPFADVPRYYRKRLEMGKESAGIVLKLGCNSLYGKMAQSVGASRPFQCWIWAGLITSGTRAQILEALGLHNDWRDLLMVATDGIYSRQRLTLPTPRETDTGGLYHKEQTIPKPLGGWEEKEVRKGVFLARPGIYFPLNPTDAEIQKVRARGVGRAVMFKNWQAAVDAHARGEMEVKLTAVGRFHGAVSSIQRFPIEGMPGQFRYVRRPYYGQWSDMTVKLSFDPLPKREGVSPDGELGIRAFGPEFVSMPYRKMDIEEAARLGNKDAVLMQALTIEAGEQADGGDYVDGGFVTGLS